MIICFFLWSLSLFIVSSRPVTPKYKYESRAFSPNFATKLFTASTMFNGFNIKRELPKLIFAAFQYFHKQILSIQLTRRPSVHIEIVHQTINDLADSATLEILNSLNFGTQKWSNIFRLGRFIYKSEILECNGELSNCCNNGPATPSPNHFSASLDSFLYCTCFLSDHS